MSGFGLSQSFRFSRWAHRDLRREKSGDFFFRRGLTEVVIMLTNSQLRFLLPRHNMDAFNVPKNRSLRKCLFGRPDPEETRRLLEEQFAADRRYMITKYNYDLLTCRLVSSNCCHEYGQTVAESQDNFLVPESTDEEVEKRRCSPESEVRHRAGRYAPYSSRQTKITGK